MENKRKSKTQRKREKELQYAADLSVIVGKEHVLPHIEAGLRGH
jgi:hypothetical protein